MNIVKSHANIALIKYWGKADEDKVLPYNSSISLTLDAFYTKTLVLPSENLEKDCFILNGRLQNEAQTEKVAKILDFFRPLRAKPHYCTVISYNSMPTAAGLSSSSSGLSALILATDLAFPQTPPRTTAELASLSRLASGSSCRSFFAPFAEWKKDGSVEAVDCPLDLSMLILILEDKEKEVSSRLGMKHTVQTSSKFHAWAEQAEQDAHAMLVAMKDKDFDRMGELMEANTLLMHETTRYAKPPFSYLTEETWDTLEKLQTIRQNEALSFYFTMDAGPNIKLLCPTQDLYRLEEKLKQHFPHLNMVASTSAQNAFEIINSNALHPHFDETPEMTAHLLHYHTDSFKKTPDTKVYKSPSKLFLMGEYAVTKEKHRAIVLSIPKYTLVSCTPRETQINEPHTWTLSSSLFPQQEAKGMDLLYKALDFIALELKKQGIEPKPYHLHLDTELYDFANKEIPHKLGLGSSASVLAVLFKALLDLHAHPLSPLGRFKLIARFCLQENISGSYADLACCVFEQDIVYQNFSRTSENFEHLDIKPYAFPQGFHLLAYFSKTSASTAKLLEKTSIPPSFYAQSEEIINKFLEHPSLEHIEEAKHLLKSLEAHSFAPLETEALKVIFQYANLPNSASKWSGAGGGDCALMLCQSQEEHNRIKKTCPYPLIFEK